MQDLTASMSLDTSDFVNPIIEAAQKVQETTASIVDSVKKQASAFTASTGVVVPQVQAMARASEEAGDRVAQASSADMAKGWSDSLKTFATVGLTAVRVASLFYPKANILGQSLGRLGWAAYGAQRIVNTMPDAHSKAAEAAERQARSTQNLAEKQSKLADVGIGKIVVKDVFGEQIASAAKLAEVAGASALFATVMYKSGIDEVIEASGRYLNTNSALMKSLSSITNSFVSCVMTGIDMFSEGIKGSLMAVITATTGYASLTDIVDDLGSAATKGAATVSDGFKYMADNARDAGLVFGTALAIFQSGGQIDASAFYEEGQALNKLAEDTQRVIEKQEAMRSALEVVATAQKSVTDGVVLQQKLAAVALMGTTAEIDSQIAAIKLETSQTDKSITNTKLWKKNTAELVQALEKRRIAIENGKSEDSDKHSKPSAMYDQMAEQLNRLNFGQDEAARMAIQASDATEEWKRALLGVHDEIVRVTAIEKEQKQADQLAKSAADQVNNLRDQIDELTGSYTKAEIAARKMLRAGHTQEQANEVGALQAELDKLREKDPKKQKTELNAALRGSKEAASVTMRGVGGSADPKVKLQQDTNKILKTIAQNTSPAKTGKQIKLLPANIRA